MPQFEIVLKSPALGEIVRGRFASTDEDALDDFLAQMQPQGVKRTSGTTARFLDEIEISVRQVGEVVPMYAGALAAPGREMWRR